MSVHWEDVRIVDIYITITGAPKYIKELLTNLKVKLYNKVMIVEDFSSPFSTIDGSSRENQQENIGLELYFQPNWPNKHIQNIPSNCSKIHILANPHWTFSKIDHMLAHKKS